MVDFNKLPRPANKMTTEEYRKWQKEREVSKQIRESMMTKQDIITEAHQGGMKDYFAKLLGVNIAETLIECGLLRTCLNCDNWITGNETCSLAGKRPPAKVIVTGCEKHTDIIPF